MNRSESREELDQKHTEAKESEKNTETDRQTKTLGSDFTETDGRTKSRVMF